MYWVNIYKPCATHGIRIQNKRILQEKNHSLLPPLPAPFSSPPSLCSSSFTLLLLFFFWKQFYSVAQAGLEVESAGITGIPIMPLTVVILWDTPPHTHPFLKKELSALSNCHSKLLHGLSFSSPRRLLAC